MGYNYSQGAGFMDMGLWELAAGFVQWVELEATRLST